MSHSCCYYGYSLFTPVTHVVLRCQKQITNSPKNEWEKKIGFYWFWDKNFTKSWLNQIQTWTSFQNICWNLVWFIGYRWSGVYPLLCTGTFALFITHQHPPHLQLNNKGPQSQRSCETLNKPSDTITVKMTKVAHMSLEDIKSSLRYSHTSNDTSSHCCRTWAHTINLLPECESNQPQWIKMYN